MALAMLLLLTGAANAWTVDGNLGDWGVQPGPYGASDWVPNAGVSWIEEDQNTNYPGPGYGGQSYDVEAIYSYVEGSRLWVAVVTGFPPTGLSGYKAGDLQIKFPGASTYYSFGLRTVTESGMTAGGVYLTNPGNWQTASYPASGASRMIGNLGYQGSAQFFYGAQANFAANGYHYIIEASIPISTFGSYWGGTYQLHWTMTCGNDALDLTATVPGGGGVIPEPEPFLLLALGLFGLWFRGTTMRRRRERIATGT